MQAHEVEAHVQLGRRELRAQPGRARHRDGGRWWFLLAEPDPGDGRDRLSIALGPPSGRIVSAEYLRTIVAEAGLGARVHFLGNVGEDEKIDLLLLQAETLAIERQEAPAIAAARQALELATELPTRVRVLRVLADLLAVLYLGMGLALALSSIRYWRHLLFSSRPGVSG